ncbi:MAG: hypothetical protein B7Y37_05550 [Sphingobacteriia bacterium 28-36-52]|nr:MAG: hypothetical protein B7Z27_01355 [Sphingobacteriia bacterium 32-37-4]OYZ01626.1 MAG: hypothetical protein B7Y37_05550 [Sphingobacteriia bacterium 28-36-52]
MNLKVLVIGCFLFCSGYLNAQQYSQVVLKDIPFEPNIAMNADLVKKLEQNSVYQSASKAARSFIYWTNFARLYPMAFRDEALLPFIKLQPSLKGKYANSLIKDLGKITPLPFLEPELKLTMAAQLHAEDIAQNNGRVSHQSSDGASFSDRMKKVGYKNCSGENISLGNDNEGLSSLLLLYLDINLPDLGHRKNLFNPNYTKIGVSVKQLPNNQFLIVQELGCGESSKN